MQKSLIFITIFLIGCSSNAPKFLDLQSKKLVPPEGMTILYFIKEEIYSCPPLSGALMFSDKYLGKYSCGQYLYFYTYPMSMDIIGKNDELIRLELEAGDITYLLYKYPRRGGVKGLYYEVLSKDKGKEIINKFHLSNSSEKIVLGTKPEYKNINKIAKNELIYNSKSKIGKITIESNLNNRNTTIRKIEKICSTKNIAIQVGSNNHEYGATYTTLNESLKNGKLTINFKCLY